VEGDSPKLALKLLFDGERRGGATDILIGGDGTDVLDSFNKPAKKDVLTCGSGFDRVLADRKDGSHPPARGWP
jgi:hypothetical protein